MIAEETGGKYFDAPTAEALEAAYFEAGSLLEGEPGETEATFAFLAAAAALALLAGALGALCSAGFRDERLEPVEADGRSPAGSPGPALSASPGGSASASTSASACRHHTAASR